MLKLTGRWWVTAVSVVLILGGAVAVVQSPVFVRKLLMAAFNPVALSWLGLMAAALLALGHRRKLTASLLVGATLLLTVASNGLVAGALLRSLECDFYAFDPDSLQQLDAIIVLGGGVSLRRNGTAQVNASGDRVVMAARLYHRGQALRLITCSDAIPALNMSETASATATIWKELGVPPEAIIKSRGSNTAEELQFAQQLAAKSNWQRVGLLTSAWHLARAMKHAERNGFEVIPIPADFLTDGEPSPIVFAFVPSPGALQATHRAMLEYLAMAVGR